MFIRRSESEAAAHQHIMTDELNLYGDDAHPCFVFRDGNNLLDTFRYINYMKEFAAVKHITLVPHCQ